MSNEKKHCSGIHCPMQHTTMNTKSCKCVDTCDWYTPVQDFNSMEAVIEIAAKQFGIVEDSDKQKLRILFNAYVVQYLSMMTI